MESKIKTKIKFRPFVKDWTVKIWVTDMGFNYRADHVKVAIGDGKFAIFRFYWN